MQTGQHQQQKALHQRVQLPHGVKAKKANFIGAVGTPLDEQENLHQQGLEQLLNRQWSEGIKTILVAGTMGVMQLLRDETYRNLVQQSAALAQGNGEILVGCGDTSLARTKQRVEFLNTCNLDGIVVLSPYFIPFKQEELYRYYIALADASRHPLYVYEIPPITKVKLDVETVERLAEHPNIHGIKCSREWEWTQTLIDRLGNRFRIMAVQLEQMDSLLKQGVMEHLDGVYALMPSWTTELIRAAERGDWETAAEYRQRIVHVRDLLRKFGSFRTATAIWNSQGVTGNFAPAPMYPLNEQEREALFADPIMQLEPR